MILAMDVDYRDDGSAMAAGVLFQQWHSAAAEDRSVVRVRDIAPYQPGQFYLRELPCLMVVIEAVKTLPDTIVIDGYVTLGTEQRPGLGMHLFNALEGRIPIVGIAKTWFAGTPSGAELRRGHSVRPLYVSAVGIDLQEAIGNVAHMHGPYRIPTLIAEVDRLCRSA